MLTKRRYSTREMIVWTRWEIFYTLAYSTAIVVLYEYFQLNFLLVPWLPVALIGTAVAFIIGFQNNAAYGRIWEARKIWGGIVNVSRAWGMKTRDMIESGPDHYTQWQALVRRHIAWLISLRHALRQKRPWEVFDEQKTNREWLDLIYTPERIKNVQEEIFLYLDHDEGECGFISKKMNRSAALIYLQSQQLRRLKESGQLWEFAFLELENLLQEMLELQGKSERIKNFPYPRQYATLSSIFVWIFLVLLPFGVIPEFASIRDHLSGDHPIAEMVFVWFSIPFCAVVSWVFYTMERIGRAGENPFEGTGNDVPISTISRAIEIELLQLLGVDEESIPSQFPEKEHIQM